MVRIALLSLGSALVGCTSPSIELPGPERSPLAPDEQDTSARFSIDLSDTEEDAVLALANTASFEELDDDVGLDSRAAEGIVEERPFSTLDELDAVPWVGDAALARLLEYVDVPAGPATVHGYEEGSAEAEVILWAASRATPDELDFDIGLDSRAAASIVAYRQSGSLTSLELLDSLSWVGASAFGKLSTWGTEAGGGWADAPEACPEGKIVTGLYGNEYDDFESALEYGDTLYYLCDGQFELDGYHAIERDLTLIGVGVASLQIDTLVTDQDLTLRNLTISGDVLQVDYSGSSVRSDLVMERVLSRLMWTRVEWTSVELHDSSIQGYNLEVGQYSTMVAEETWFSGSDHQDGGVHLIEGTAATILGGGVHDNVGGFYVAHGSGPGDTSLELEGVDFGLDSTANDDHDIWVDGEAPIIDLGEDIWGRCDADGCTFE